MNGGHDLGGMHGLGAINPESEVLEPVFHHEWERRAFALTLACGFLGQWNLDQGRQARESQHPADYLKNSYYENWMHGLETLLQETGLVDADELHRGGSNREATADLLERRVVKNAVEEIIHRGGPVDMPATAPAGFKAGTCVRVINKNPTGHTRVPRYARGRLGTVQHHHGCHVFADDNATGVRRAEHLYSVKFDASELWGESDQIDWQVNIDLWEPHLELA
ncbi:MAG: nitrile hydratase beta subunit [Parasphingorhabdus sp.]|jgi:nitrile hydratase beta subunit